MLDFPLPDVHAFCFFFSFHNFDIFIFTNTKPTFKVNLILMSMFYFLVKVSSITMEKPLEESQETC